MVGAAIEASTRPDGTMVIHPRGALDVGAAVELRRLVVNAVRRERPLRLIFDLHDVDALDPINIGTLAATCELGDDHQIAVFFDHCSITITSRLLAAGVPLHRLRRQG